MNTNFGTKLALAGIGFVAISSGVSAVNHGLNQLSYNLFTPEEVKAEHRAAEAKAAKERELKIEKEEAERAAAREAAAKRAREEQAAYIAKRGYTDKQARDLTTFCRIAAKNASVTGRISDFGWDSMINTIVEGADDAGYIVYSSSFRAENAFGTKMKHYIGCSLSPRGIFEVNYIN